MREIFIRLPTKSDLTKNHFKMCGLGGPCTHQDSCGRHKNALFSRHSSPGAKL